MFWLRILHKNIHLKLNQLSKNFFLVNLLKAKTKLKKIAQSKP